MQEWIQTFDFDSSKEASWGTERNAKKHRSLPSTLTEKIKKHHQNVPKTAFFFGKKCIFRVRTTKNISIYVFKSTTRLTQREPCTLLTTRLQTALFNAHYTLQNENCILLARLQKMHTIGYTMYTTHYTLHHKHNVHSTLHSNPWTANNTYSGKNSHNIPGQSSALSSLSDLNMQILVRLSFLHIDTGSAGKCRVSCTTDMFISA